MDRYSVIDTKDKREIVLLQSFPCVWGKCTFCDYIDDNTKDLEPMIRLNKEVLQNVTGKYKKLEVTNSASVFELPEETLKDIKEVAINKSIQTLVFEVYLGYKNRLEEIRDYFEEVEVEFKTGIETFDDCFRSEVLNVGIPSIDVEEISDKFDVICLMVGIKGQTKDMIRRDIELSENFDRVAINIYRENSTPLQRDQKLIQWFLEEYSHLIDDDRVDMLLEPTDFGVGD